MSLLWQHSAQINIKILFSYNISFTLSLPRTLSKTGIDEEYLQGVAITEHFPTPKIKVLSIQK